MFLQIIFTITKIDLTLLMTTEALFGIKAMPDGHKNSESLKHRGESLKRRYETLKRWGLMPHPNGTETHGNRMANTR
ncbi:hypothetical protein MTBBW1_840003 [Desulfamplus magnetovallimortis]|uniref:Uncharacterized protein n=1 Tax=Desulfamplus magnetovallimortis TaxID=1246637 RepID=A0A1W1HKQ8_9BACT|nr:hypothetical protein MTBBW1_840003 [Desulfamplus magnetovallimortis]